MNYPKRASHFAHRATRRLFNSCAAQEIGHQAALLVIHIAHAEDAARYQKPARFWNLQLMNTLGFTSPKQLNKARRRAIDAGWLHYERSSNQQVGRYWVTVPADVAQLDDSPMDEDNIRSPGGTNTGMNGTSIHSPGGTNVGMNPGTDGGTESGKHSNPVPTPNPGSCGEVASPPADAPPADFDTFWTAYPPRNNRKREKRKAQQEWNRLSAAQRRDALAAAPVYATEEDKKCVKDAFRWLRDHSFEAWLQSAESDDKPQLPETPDDFAAAGYTLIEDVQ